MKVPSRGNRRVWLVRDPERTEKARVAREQVGKARQEKPNMLNLLGHVSDPVSTGSREGFDQ